MNPLHYTKDMQLTDGKALTAFTVMPDLTIHTNIRLTHVRQDNIRWRAANDFGNRERGAKPALRQLWEAWSESPPLDRVQANTWDTRIR